jgi:hypothetical protein
VKINNKKVVFLFEKHNKLATGKPRGQFLRKLDLFLKMLLFFNQKKSLHYI